VRYEIRCAAFIPEMEMIRSHVAITVAALLCPPAATAFPVAVTVDDLPSAGPLPPNTTRVAVLEQMLAAFHKHRLPAVYGFVNGVKLPALPEGDAILRRWREAGNRLGNHTYSHASLNALPVENWIDDARRNELVLARFAPSSEWKVFRYPFLFEGDTEEKKSRAKAFLRGSGYLVAEVSIDADDWAYAPPFARCLRKGDAKAVEDVRRAHVAAHVSELRYMRVALRKLAGRESAQVLLLHLNAIDADRMDALLTAYENEGARFVELREALADPVYAMDPGVAVKWGAAFPYLLAKGRSVELPPPPPTQEQRIANLCPDGPAAPAATEPAGHSMQRR
jgi:peptidoglycan/xylan/chitin deacetylase (PgdA/CDA1 family)